jgi:hypothetical protein
VPEGTLSFHFNLYEGEGSFHVQLIGSRRFSLDDPDWPCDETFSSDEDIFELPQSIVGTAWEMGLEAAKAAVLDYMVNGAKASVLRASSGIGVGFVDGDVEILWQRDPG